MILCPCGERAIIAFKVEPGPIDPSLVGKFQAFDPPVQTFNMCSECTNAFIDLLATIARLGAPRLLYRNQSTEQLS